MKEIFNDKTISFKAVGLYFTIETLLKNNKEITVHDLINMSSDGERLIRGALNELIEKGYIERKTLRSNGKIKGVKYSILK